MNVLLLSPEFPQTFWSYTHALRFIGKKAVSPPLGLLTVAALLPSSWNKRLVDLSVQTWREEDLQWADCFFISAMGIQREATLALVKRCKAAGKTIVAGGPLFTADEAFFDEVDHFILGEGELTLPPFLKDLANGNAQRFYRPQAGEYADMAASPAPMWELLNANAYNCMSLQYSRGCPFACEFCSVTAMLGRVPRVKRVEQVLHELDGLVARGWRGPVFFVDDNLIGRRKDVKADLLPALARWQAEHHPLALQTQVSIDLADDAELVELMCLAGFDTVFVGIETPEESSLAECGKRQNRGRDLAASVRLLQRAGLEVQAGFIVGFDNDTPATFQRQIDFIQRCGIATAMVGLLQALSGTRLYERLEREHRLLRNSTGNNVDGSTNFVPRMGMDCLNEGYAQLLRGIYAPRPYYQRVRRFLREYRRPQIQGAMDAARVQAFFRSLLHLGILGRERWQFWHLLTWTALRRPVMFSKAVQLAICGHHYMHISRECIAAAEPAHA